MQLIDRPPTMPTLPPHEAMVLFPEDVPGFHLAFGDFAQCSNEAVAQRAENPERHLHRLLDWGRIDGYAVRYLPDRVRVSDTAPIVIDSSVTRFEHGAGAMRALMDESALAGGPGTSQLFPRNIADNTTCLRSLFEEAGVQFALYRVDFRVRNIVGSIGLAWRWPHGGPVQALRIAERQVSRMRTAVRLPAGASARAAGWKEGQL